MILLLKDVFKQRDAGASFRLHVRSFSVQRGEHIAIIGPSGCGKSTTLDMLGLILRPDSVRSFLFVSDSKPLDLAMLWQQGQRDRLSDIRRRYIGYVLQTGELFPFLTVEENILLTCTLAGIEPAKARKRLAELLRHLEITHLRRSMPVTLSSGERQRVAIARAMAPRPMLLLADEPTAALDPGLARRVMRLFLEIVREERTALVLVSHDLDLVREFSFREVALEVSSNGERFTSVLDEHISWPS